LPWASAIKNLVELSDTMYAYISNTGSGQFCASYGAFSVDHGASWSPLATPANVGTLKSLGGSGNTLYAFGDHGFSTSHDGKTWGDVVAHALCHGPFDLSTKGILISCQDVGLLHSVDNGQTWVTLHFGSFPPGAIAPTGIIVSGDALFAWATKPTQPGEPRWGIPFFYRSVDLGASWDEVSHSGDTTVHLWGVFGRVNLYAIMRQNGSNTPIPLISADHGLSWTIRGTNVQWLPDLPFNPGDLDPNIVEYADSRVCTNNIGGSNRGGVYCSGDTGASWQWVIKGFPDKPDPNNQPYHVYPAVSLVSSNRDMFVDFGNFEASGASDGLWQFFPD
jgi:hypothetical protein